MGPTTGGTPAMATNPKFIFFTDFDGTITTADSNDYMTDTLGFGRELRSKGNQDVLFGKVNFRDSFRDMLDSISTPYNECIETLCQHIELDPGFKEFYAWSRENNVPIVILSGGMQPIITALLNKLLGNDWEIQVISNDVAPRDGMDINDKHGWQIKYHDERFVSSHRKD